VAKPGGGGEQYLAPQHGYLYYKAKPEQKPVCEKEWADLKSLAGTHQCVAFGSRYQEKGRVRKATDPQTNPDVYPVALGITKVKKAQYGPVKQLFEASSASPAKPDSKALAER
jgi:hypothetical protein